MDHLVVEDDQRKGNVVAELTLDAVHFSVPAV